MNKREAYLILLGFISENCNDDDEFMLSVALEALYNDVNKNKTENKQPLITSRILDDGK